MPDVEAFRSYAEQGKMPPKNFPPEKLEQWDGVSVLESREQAVAYQRLFPRLGSFIAELRIPEDATIQRGPADENGHFNLRAPGDVIFQYVTHVTSV